MKKLVLIFMVFVSYAVKAQENTFPKNPKAGETYMMCYDEKGASWTKMIKSPSEKTILKIQKQLNFLDYLVVETGVLDTQTLTKLNQFNEEHNLKSSKFISVDSQKTLQESYKKKKKAQRKNS